MVDDKDHAAGTAPTVAETTNTEPSGRGDYLPFELPPPGYALGNLLGKGGMGEVIVAQDRRVGREVAYKRMRNPNADTEALGRFLREARIQARLDHPAIVPVHEIGKDDEGRPYFTMKRLAGQTLAERLAAPGEPLQPLLRAFVEVCLAIELAHSKGVIHRDLKPQNIMLGDFGEVYVLDWGVARLVTERARHPTGADRGDIESIGEHTSDGTMLGTVGYMAPEQMRGEQVGPAADVYALGSVLFEILTGEPLHPRGHPAVASTLAMETASPAERTPDRAIAPELDALCSDALAADPDRRPTARELAQRVQAYLDGDRDLERRRVLAREYLAAAREALASGNADRRADSLRAAGRALALDPESTEAADLVMSLIVKPPAVLPTALDAELAAAEVELAKKRARKAVTSYLSLLTLSVMLVWFEIRNWSWLIAIYAGIAGFIALSWSTYKTGRIYLWQILLGTTAMAVLFSRLSSPYVLVPSLMCGTALAVCNIPALNDRPWHLYVWMAICAVLPQALEWAGVIQQTTRISEGHFLLESAIFGTGGSLGVVSLFAANTVFLIVVTRFAVMLATDRRAAQRSLIIQAWHLHQLLPKTAQVTSDRAKDTQQGYPERNG